MTTTVESSNDVMVKPPIITRKSRQFQTAVERWSTLRQNSSRSFDRLNLRNKFEEDRLVQKHRDISELSDAQLRDLLRVKNEMRVTLVDIAKSKRQYSSKESEFESRLRNGNQSPIFKMEYRRLRKKQVELGKLCEQLQGPNSKLLASNLTTELKAVDAKATKEALRGESKFKSKWLAPLKALQQAQEAAGASGGAATEGSSETNKPTPNEFASLVKLVHKKFKKASISAVLEGKDSARPAGKSSEHTQTQTEVSKPSTDNSTTENNSKTHKESSQGHTDSEQQKGIEESPLRPPSRPPSNALIPISSAISLLATSPTKSVKVPAVRRKKRQRLPTVPEVTERATPKNPEPPAKLKPKHIKKQKARAAMIKGMHKGTDAHVSRTESAHRRDRMMKKRLSDLATRTKEDIANRRSISPHDEALSSIHQAEVVARLQLARSKVGITLPEVRAEKGERRKPRRRSKDETSISLPPVNIEGRLLRELKEQRRKHKTQSTGLPKLP